MTSMQQLLNYLKKERSVLPLPIEWDKCYQGIEMMIENTYIPLEKEQIEYAWNSAGGGDAYHSGKEYYQETFVSKGSDDTFKVWECCGMEECICKHPSVISENGNKLLFDKEGNLIKELPKQETLYTEEQATEFAKWLAANWFPMWVKDKFVWEHDWDKTCEEQKYQGYYNEKELFNLFLSLKNYKL